MYTPFFHVPNNFVGELSLNNLVLLTSCSLNLYSVTQ